MSPASRARRVTVVVAVLVAETAVILLAAGAHRTTVERVALAAVGVSLIAVLLGSRRPRKQRSRRPRKPRSRRPRKPRGTGMKPR